MLSLYRILTVRRWNRCECNNMLLNYANLCEQQKVNFFFSFKFQNYVNDYFGTIFLRKCVIRIELYEFKFKRLL